MGEVRHHIIFNPSGAATLRQALEQAGRGEDVFCTYDSFSFGPIASDDPNARLSWVEQELACPNWRDIADSTAEFLAASSGADGSPVVWMSRCDAGSYAGFLWWLDHVGDTPRSVIEATGLNILNPQGMIDLLDHDVPLTDDDRRRYRARWRALKAENAPFRVVTGDDLVSAPIDHFDALILGLAKPQWQKMAMIVARGLVYFMDAELYQTGDLVLAARLAALA